MVVKKATVQNRAGIHVRPSGVIVAAAGEYSGSVVVKAKGMETDLTNVIGLLAMGLVLGDGLEVTVTGPDEEHTCEKFVQLLEKEYDFPPRK